jgi:hypothetical protein
MKNRPEKTQGAILIRALISHSGLKLSNILHSLSAVAR